MSKFTGGNYSQKELNHYANQMNPNSKAYKARMNNRANQKNPNNREYYRSRNNSWDW